MSLSSYGTVNPALLGLAYDTVAKQAKDAGEELEKEAFVPGGDPMAGGMPPGGGGAPPMDPSMMGGMPPGGGGMPMDPSMMGGMPPGGAPAPGGTTPDMLMQQVAQGAMPGAGGGKGGMKVDQNMVMLQMLKLMARIADTLGVKVNAQDMVITPEDVGQMAEGGPMHAAMTPDGGGGGAPPGGGIGAIQPIGPPPGAEKPAEDLGQVYEGIDTSGLADTTNKAMAIAAIQRRKAG